VTKFASSFACSLCVFCLWFGPGCTGASTKQVDSSDDGVVQGDPSVTRCPLHGDPLLEDLVLTVPGGLMDMVPPGIGGDGVSGTWQPEYEWQAEGKEFPFAHSQWPTGGCCPGPQVGKLRVRVRYCPTCRAVQIEWRLAHPDFARQPYHPSDHSELTEGDAKEE